MSWDVLVVGAGPAGAVAATVLARAGARVALIDRPDTSAERIGETLPGAAARALRRLGLPTPGPGTPHRPVRGTLSAWAGPVTAQDTLTDPDGPAWRLDRARFDADLRAAAAEQGVRAVRGWFRSVERTGAAWSVDLDTGPRLTAHRLVDATGRRARLARALGATRRPDAALVAVWALAPAAPEGTDRTLIESVDDGWWYAVRLPDDRALAAFHTDPRTATELLTTPGRWWARLASTRLIATELDVTRFTDPVLRVADAKGGFLSPPAGEGWVACGDAALYFDPLASQGLLNAIATGHAAAQAILDPALLTGYVTTLQRVRRTYAARAEGLYRRLGYA
jgi:flavin-dependent dehydrogenase